MSGARWVIHMDLDAFFASVEQLTRPTLRGRPVLVGGAGPRGVVAGASYEARAHGAHSAMPMHRARRLVGMRAVVVPPRGRVYRVAGRRVFAEVRAMMPVIERLSVDEAFAEPGELAGAAPADVAAYCERMRARIRHSTGLVVSVGAGSGKQVAKTASGLAKPDGLRVVAPSEERAFMDPLPVRTLWGIGPVADERLRRLGVETVGQFAGLDRAEVVSLLGATVGPALQDLARGIDDREVAERAEAKQVSAETTFQTDLHTRPEIRAALRTTGEAAHRRLLADGRGARTIVTKFRKSDMSVVTRSRTLSYATTDRDVLIAAAQKAAVDPGETGPIRLVGVGFAGLSALQQTVLFPDLDMEDIDTEDIDTEDLGEAGIGEAGIGETRAHSEQAHSEHADFGQAGPGRGASASPAPRDGPPAPGEDPADPGGRPGSAGLPTGFAAGGPAPGEDVRHRLYGHGWVQGSGHGVVTVRFETRARGPGRIRTFAVDDPHLAPADPLASLDWPPEWTGGGTAPDEAGAAGRPEGLA